MGRGRVEMRRIESKIRRQVSFSKRRSGLLKKAHEISVMCEAQVALIIFSTKGKLFHYSSTHSSMNSILERHERYSYAERQHMTTTDGEVQENWCLEFPMLTAKIQLLERNIRHYMGEELDPLSLQELQSLEQQLDTALKRIRTRKNQLMHESISELQKKERGLQVQNKGLAKKLKEKEETEAELREHQGHTSSHLHLPPLSISSSRDDGAEPPPPTSTPSVMPSWMLLYLTNYQ